MQNKYHGWISVLRSEGYADRFVVEHQNVEGEGTIRKEYQSPAQAIQYFDRLAGENVLLTETPLGAYRVYTEVNPPKVDTARAATANLLRTELHRIVPVVRRDYANLGDGMVGKLCDVAEQLAELTK